MIHLISCRPCESFEQRLDNIHIDLSVYSDNICASNRKYSLGGDTYIDIYHDGISKIFLMHTTIRSMVGIEAGVKASLYQVTVGGVILHLPFIQGILSIAAETIMFLSKSFALLYREVFPFVAHCFLCNCANYVTDMEAMAQRIHEFLISLLHLIGAYFRVVPLLGGFCAKAFDDLAEVFVPKIVEYMTAFSGVSHR